MCVCVFFFFCIKVQRVIVVILTSALVSHFKVLRHSVFRLWTRHCQASFPVRRQVLLNNYNQYCFFLCPFLLRFPSCISKIINNVFFLIAFHCAAGETCVNSFYQDYGLIQLPPSSLFRHPPALSCRWTFTAKEGNFFQITIHKFHVEEFVGCGRGYAEVSEPNLVKGPRL